MTQKIEDTVASFLFDHTKRDSGEIQANTKFQC